MAILPMQLANLIDLYMFHKVFFILERFLGENPVASGNSILKDVDNELMKLVPYF